MMASTDVLSDKAYKMRKRFLELFTELGYGHLTTAFSETEILVALSYIIRISTDQADKDYLVLSKGHGVLALYTALWKKGLMTEGDLATFETDGTLFHGHAHRNLEKGIEFSGGSLGLGISYAVGVAKACKDKGLNNRIYVILGDGEMDEGIVWEALMAIVNFGLNNVTVIIDRNQYQLDGPTNEIMNLLSIEDKMKSFGYNVETVDGHSIPELLDTFGKASEKPRAIIANTIKANGISFLMNNKMSHQCVLPKKKYELAVEEIKQAYNGK